MHDASIVGHFPNDCCDNYHELFFVNFSIFFKFCKIYVNFLIVIKGTYINDYYSEKEKAGIVDFVI